MKSLKVFLSVLTCVTLASCVKDKPNVTSAPNVQLSDDKKVYIVNEGNFMAANSSVSLYDPGTNEVIENFFHSANNSVLGDVAQSINFFNSSWYIVVNNSNKIVVCDKHMKQKAVISGLQSPRYITRVSNSKAYVSDLYANNIKVIDLNTNSVTGSINCAGWTEQMIFLYGKIFVTNLKRNYVYVIDVTNDLIKDSIEVGPNAGSIVSDKYDKLWVLSAGNQSQAVLPTLRRIDPLTNQVQKTFEFSAAEIPGNLCINGSGDTLFFLNSGVYRMPVNGTALPASAFIPKGNKTFYGLGVNPNDYCIYVSDALDYIQRANIYVFDSNGSQKNVFKAGINSNSFYFE